MIRQERVYLSMNSESENTGSSIWFILGAAYAIIKTLYQIQRNEAECMEIQLWRQILCPYELAVRELTVKFNHMIKEHHEKDLYSPITQVFGRVKSVASILDKLQRKNIPLDRLEQEMDDIAGIRLICQFVEDIAKVEELVMDIQIVHCSGMFPASQDEPKCFL